MVITWNTDVNAPCLGEILGEGGRSILIQTDWDYPGTASTFGWDISSVQDAEREQFTPCRHQETDGTVDCKECGIKAGTFIAAAVDWLADNDGAQVEDPGYFLED